MAEIKQSDLYKIMRYLENAQRILTVGCGNSAGWDASVEISKAMELLKEVDRYAD